MKNHREENFNSVSITHSCTAVASGQDGEEMGVSDAEITKLLEDFYRKNRDGEGRIESRERELVSDMTSSG